MSKFAKTRLITLTKKMVPYISMLRAMNSSAALSKWATCWKIIAVNVLPLP